MKLLERYASACGVSVGNQFLAENFFPLPFQKYITLQASSGMAAKNYPKYNEVIRMIFPFLDSQGIKIIQLGGEGDAPINGCFHLQGKTSLSQTNYILGKSLLHVGNDSWISHRAGFLQIPLVTLFGSTSIENHSPYTFNLSKTIFLESHRWGKKPTFASQENPSTISLIPPEKVANSILSLLGINESIKKQSRFWGILSDHTVFEIVPDAVPDASFMPQAPLTVRMDYQFNEENLAKILQTGRQVHIITDKSINLQILANHKHQIITYNHEIAYSDNDGDYPNLGYVTSIKAVIPKYAFYTKEKDERKQKDIKFRYFDYVTIELISDCVKSQYIDEALKYLNLENNEKNKIDIENELKDTKIRSNKFLMAGGFIYLSLAHLKNGKSIQSLDQNEDYVIDDPFFWKDFNHFYFFYERS